MKTIFFLLSTCQLKCQILLIYCFKTDKPIHSLILNFVYLKFFGLFLNIMK